MQLPLNCKKGGEGKKRLQMVDGEKKERKKDRKSAMASSKQPR